MIMKIPIDVFISHADEDKKIAREIGDVLEKVKGLTVFVAHDDLDIGINWKSDLVKRINECDAFVILLTKNFHSAEWTEQEIGLAQAFKKPMYPIRFDDSKAYGFAGEFQAKRINYPIDEDEIKNLADMIFALSEQGQRQINSYIDLLGESGSFVSANDRATLLFQTTTKFTDDQINKLAYNYIHNNQIRGAWTAKAYCLELFQKNRKKIKEDLRTHIDSYLQS